MVMPGLLSSCGAEESTHLSMDPFDQSLVTRGEEVPTIIAAGSKGAAPPPPRPLRLGEEVPTAIAAGSKGAAPPRPLRLGAVAVDATEETPLLGRPPRTASKSAFLFPLLVGMATRINAELWMMAQNGRKREW
jgi:hypothetical protein